MRRTKSSIMTEELCGEIQNGLFDNAERFLMTSEIKCRYNTSYMTAIKVMEELMSRNLVFRRKGFVYVNRDPTARETIPESAICKILFHPKKTHHLQIWQRRFIPAIQNCLLERNVRCELLNSDNSDLTGETCHCWINVSHADDESASALMPLIKLSWHQSMPDAVFVDYRRCFDEIINHFFSVGVNKILLCAGSEDQAVELRGWIRHCNFMKSAENYNISADELSYIPIEPVGKQPDYIFKQGVKYGILSPDASGSHALRQRLERNHRADNIFEIVTLAALPEDCWCLGAHVCLDEKLISQAVLKMVAQKLQTDRRLPAQIIVPELKIANHNLMSRKK